MGLLCQSEQGAQCGAQSLSHGCSIGVRWRRSGLSQSTHIWATVNGETQRDAAPQGTYGGCLPTGCTSSPGTSSALAGEHWGSPPLTGEVPELALFLGLLSRCLYTSEVWCPTCLAARCRRPLLVPWLFCSMQGLCFPKSKLFFPLIWSSASPGTWDILAVPGIVTSLGPSLSSGDWFDHEPVKEVVIPSAAEVGCISGHGFWTFLKKTRGILSCLL